MIQSQTIIHTLSMGGYARYVWPAYGLALCVFAANLLLPWLQARHLSRTMRSAITAARKLHASDS